MVKSVKSAPTTKAAAKAPSKGKVGQKAKATTGTPVTAIVRPVVPVGWLGNADGNTPTAAGIKPSVGYPQGTDMCKLVKPTGTLGRDQQKHYDAIHSACSGKPIACDLLAKADGVTRRTVRRAVRAGVLVWQAAK